jgi:hypothetical protein
MTNTKPLREALTALFPAKDIAWRVGTVTAEKDRGRAVPGLRPVAVQDRLDEVVGPENWGVNYRVVEADLGASKTALVVCGISLYAQDRWVTKEGSAELVAGNESGKAVNAAAAAFTRAAGLWGVGRYLQGVQVDWAALDSTGHFVAEPVLPAYLLPESAQGAVAPEAMPAAVTTVKAAPPVEAAKPAAPDAPVAGAKPAAPVGVVKAAAPVGVVKAAAPVGVVKAAAPVGVVKAAAPVAVVKAAAAEAPAAAGALAEPSADPAIGSALADAMAKLEGKALEMARNLVERAKTGTTPIGMLRNYLNGDSAKNLLADDARAALVSELDTIETQLKAAA